MEITGEPPGLSPDNWKLGFLVFKLFDRNRVTVRASCTDIRDTENDGPSAGLDRSRKISVARNCCADHNDLRPAAAPAAEARWSTKSEIDHGTTIFAGVFQRNLQAADAGSDFELSLEKTLVISMRQRTRKRDGATIRL